MLLIPMNSTKVHTRQQTQGKVFFIPDQKEEYNCIIEALYYEIRNGSYKEKLAVMSVIYNRKNSGLYPKTFCGVIWQYKQFSYTLTDFQKPYLHAKTDGDKIQLLICEEIANEVIKGKFASVLQDDVLWYARKHIKNNWTKKYKVVAEYNWHYFYKKG